MCVDEDVECRKMAVYDATERICKSWLVRYTEYMQPLLNHIL